MKKIIILFVLFILILILLFFFGQACSQQAFEVDSKKTYFLDNCSPYCGLYQRSTSIDPLLIYQWHLVNKKQTGDQVGNQVGEDLHLTKTWEKGIYGEGVTVAVVDDGIDLKHPDLIENRGSLSWNFVRPSLGQDVSEPTQKTDKGFDSHGTCVAGIVSARNNNGIGISGVAPHSTVVGYNIGQSTNHYSAAASATFKNQSYISQIDVSNNSYGPTDNRGIYFPVNQSWKEAINTGLEEGRKGHGTIYVWAAGNGGEHNVDRSNYDEMASYYGVISVCAVGQNGLKPDYSESGSNLWVCGFGSGNDGVGIVTTDRFNGRGFNILKSPIDFKDLNFTKRFDGTSAAAPTVAGVVSLILDYSQRIKKYLSWRDVKIILAKSARVNNASGWKTNGAGYNTHDAYGFGIVDTDKAVQIVDDWQSTNNSPLQEVLFPDANIFRVEKQIPVSNNSQSILVSELNIPNKDQLKIDSIEYLNVMVQLDHYNWGDLEMYLEHSGINANGEPYVTRSVLTTKHPCFEQDKLSKTINLIQKDCSKIEKKFDDNNIEYEFDFGTSKHLGEDPTGTWKLFVYDTNSKNSTPSLQGFLKGWQLKFYGSVSK